jgi:hypothetical protein
VLRSRFRRQHSVDRGLSSTSSSQSSLASLASLPPPPPLRPPDSSALLSPAAATGTNELPLFSQAASAGGFCLQLPPAGRKSAAANASARQPSAVLRSVSFGQGERLATAASGRDEEYRGGGGLGSFTSVPLFGPFPVGWEPSLLRERPTKTQRRPTEESTRVQPEVKQRQQEVTSCRSLSISSAGTYLPFPVV